MIGDLIGKPGRVAVEALLPDLRRELDIDFVTANGENVAGGMGLTASTADAMFKTGIDVMRLWFALVVRGQHRRTAAASPAAPRL